MVDPVVEVYAACQVAVRRLCENQVIMKGCVRWDDVQTGVFAYEAYKMVW